MPELKYGETPWDKLTRKELLREVQRMYAAIVSMNSVIHLCKRDEVGGFWSIPGDGLSFNNGGGSGGRVIEMARMILVPLHTKFDSENIYRAYFRYAVDLLFSPELGFGWTACDGCLNLYGDGPGNKDKMLGNPCPDCARKGKHHIRRLLKWSDLERKA
jgi:hypothetical protein